MPDETTLSDEQLEEKIQALQSVAGETEELLEEPEASDEAAPEGEAAEEEEPSEAPEAEEEEEGEIEVDEAAARSFTAALEAERQKAQLEQLRRHSARLAGEIGHLRKELERARRGEEGAEEPSPAIEKIQSQLERLESQLKSESVVRAVAEEIHQIDTRPEIVALGLEKEFQEIAPKYKDKYLQAIASGDPDEARMLTRDLTLGMVSEALALKIGRLKAEQERRKMGASAAHRERKIAASATRGGSGARPAKERTVAEMSDKELDSLIDSLIKE